MKEKIALLLQSHYIGYCREKLSGKYEDCLTYLQYDSLKQLQTLFLENKTRYAGFLVSGLVPLSALREVDEPPYAVKGSFGGQLENTYRILLGCVMKRPGLDPTRIGMDYWDDGSLLPEVLEQDRMPELVADFEARMAGMTEDQLTEMEEQLAQNYLRRCRAGEIDVVVTYMHRVVEVLEGENVECYYSYPSRNSLVQTIELCVKNIRLEKLRRNLAAVIRVSPDKKRWSGQSGSAHELELLALRGSLLEYCRLHQAEPILKDDLADLELYLNAEQLGEMTGGFAFFDLPSYLEENAGFRGVVSIGAGEDLNSARLHAMEAREYRARLEENVCVYIDEKGAVRSLPAAQESRPVSGVPSDYVEEIANRCHLSAETVYRVISVLQTGGTDQITSEDLIRGQNFSLRVATRVLKAMAEAGYAEKVGQKRVGNKGRPQNLYRIKLSI